jgi:hypothetical protein
MRYENIHIHIGKREKAFICGGGITVERVSMDSGICAQN